ncbi:hypothetical protein E3P86_01947 [Wallemia ichthyophaga]|uniref:FKBP12-associated protein 1-like protein n=1 Tax=Wallemia ichthyophaga TaxID=245174 RepID=A0A4T0JCH1_WALIC|nr:hypothetical protein E3P86_01947 [Wallemia ichthyophaga]
MDIPQNSDSSRPQASSRGRRGRGRGGRNRGNQKAHITKQTAQATQAMQTTPPTNGETSTNSNQPDKSKQTRNSKPNRRFNGSLTQFNSESQSPLPIPIVETTGEEDLRTRLERELKTGKVECLICFEVVKTYDKTHSCNTCFNVYHLKCISEWARASYNQPFKEGEAKHWRCPGCQTKSTKIPREYRCFCRRQRDPKPGKLAVPHSCGQSCSQRRLHCKHPCPLPCHPGPCMDCQTPIYCSYATRNPESGKVLAMSCANVCGKALDCGQHSCKAPCHPGPCSPCLEVEKSKCYCDKESSVKPCGTRGYLGKQSCYSKDEFYIALWECSNVCGEFYDCNVHQCQQLCHPPSRQSLICPLSPSVITHCPCGKHPLKDLPDGARKSCQESIASCGRMCGKQQRTCNHACKAQCHTGDCPPCQVDMTTICRCGASKVTRKCHEVQHEGDQVLCERVCHSLRLCGKHECLKRCCPLREFEDRRGKRKAVLDSHVAVPDEVMQMWHTCEIICGKTLSCGRHKCMEPDHKGKCGPCLNASFDELTCSCGSTTLEPPIPCGMQVHCSYPCNRPPSSCGHPRPAHTCHGDDVGCPPCPFLTTRTCQCGRSKIPNVRCSQETVRCGRVCDKVLDCGHKCKKPCHTGECRSGLEKCQSVCGRLRSICAHIDTSTCHGTSPCDESVSCQAAVTVTCKCGTQKAKVCCGASECTSHSKQDDYLECKNSCVTAERNSRLARALGINDTYKRKHDTNYTSEVLQFTHINYGFVSGIQKAFNEFLDSQDRALQLPLMNKSRTQFCLSYADAYGFDSEVFQDLLTVRRKIGSHLPSQLITAVVDESKQKNSGVVEFRKSATSSATPTPQLSRQGSGVSTAQQSDDWEEIS